MEEKKKLDPEEMDLIRGGYMPRGRVCPTCGGVMSDDPGIPYDIRCHCNEAAAQVWNPAKIT